MPRTAPEMTPPDPAARARDWAIGQALPLWAEAGRDPHGGFYEKLTLEGRPDAGAIRRLRVQARQIYVYSHADILGWRPGGADIAARALDRLLDIAGAEDGAAGWPHLLTPDGGVHDPRRDLYDHAFMLLALAWLHRAGEPRALKLAEATFGFVQRALADAEHGGWREDDAGRTPRRQNPHMHMFEAMMALYEATGEERWLAQAGAIFHLFGARFFDPAAGALREHFTAGWGVDPGPRGQTAEPGHEVEWVWLLGEYRRLSGADPSAFTGALLDHALRAGADPKTGFLFDAVDIATGAPRPTRRTWPQAELVKAHYAEARAGRPGALAAGRAALAALMDAYINPAPPGGWVDQFDAGGRMISTDIPASTFYHLIGAAAAASAVETGPAGRAP